MKLHQVFKLLLLSTVILTQAVAKAYAQGTESVVNNNNENVEIDVQESGSQQQGQSATGGLSEVNITEEDARDNFFSSSFRGRLVIPPGSASLSCGEQTLSFSRSEGFGFGVGAAGINFSDNAGQLPKEFQSGLTEIQSCLKEKNVAGVLQKYLQLAERDLAIANTYLRTVSPEVYATLFVESAKTKENLVSEQSFSGLSQDLRNNKFEQIVEWQDNFYGASLAKERVIFKRNQELNSLKREKRLVELEVLDLERKAQETESVLRYKQTQLDSLLEQYQDPK